MSEKNATPTAKASKITASNSIKKDDLFPSIALLSTQDNIVNLANEASNKHLVLFFYPGDKEGLRYPELMGCTPEACSFRDTIQELNKLGAIVYGASFQTSSRQKEFVMREHLNFAILSDCDKKLAHAIGLDYWRSNTGEEFPVRTTFIIAKGGWVQRIFHAVDPAQHISEVIAEIKKL